MIKTPHHESDVPLAKSATKMLMKSLGLSKVKFLWLTFANGLVIGYAPAFLAHR